MTLLPNLVAGAMVPTPVFRLEDRGGKWVTVSPTGVVRTAYGHYLFVVAADGTIYVARRRTSVSKRNASHADLAGGRDTRYAGEVQFTGRTARGRLRFWTNGSGHYRPPDSLAHQAGLPLASFVPVVP